MFQKIIFNESNLNFKISCFINLSHNGSMTLESNNQNDICLPETAKADVKVNLRVQQTKIDQV